MGTNYYRIPSSLEMEERKKRLAIQVAEIDVSPLAISQEFSFANPNGWDRYTPWDFFMQGVKIHLGKRSQGWKFCWNFHDNEYYNDKASLEEFVKSGRVIDEYGDELSADVFLQMAYEWCPDGWDSQKYHEEHPESRISWIDYSMHRDRYVDGLRISSSKDFF